MDTTFPGNSFDITEEISLDNQYYIATIKIANNTFQIKTDTGSDWLSDECLYSIENIPITLQTDKIFCFINPAIGLTGQEAWMFCGTEDNLKLARKEGLPIFFAGENIFETEEFRKYNTSCKT